jgi:gamma-glutamyltranspeptidase/glutathione hydrolase
MAENFATKSNDHHHHQHNFAASAARFPHHRSPVLCRNGCVASSQPLASSIGLDLLKSGANAAEAAIGVAAALCVLEPCSTGLGGDMFALYYESSTRQVHAINGSGYSPKELSLQVVERYQQEQQQNNEADDGGRPFGNSALAVTVPGAARGWEDLLQRHGSGTFTLAELVEPAAVLAESGFPVAPITAFHWQSNLRQISQWCNQNADHPETIPLTVDGTHAPRAGEIMTNPHMARVLRDLGRLGATKGFYQGTTGQAIVDSIRKHGGVMTMQDLANHTTSLFPEPICATFRDVKLWQIPPNGQGVAALIALLGLQHLEQHYKKEMINPETIGTADAYHVLIEMMRLGLADADSHVACPNHTKVTNEWLLDPQRVAAQAIGQFDPHKAKLEGTPNLSSWTVSFQVVDQNGNAISFVQSNYQGFGTGIVPDQCGFTLQNRGAGFKLAPLDHPNLVGGAKRPYHTIIPGLLTWSDTNELYATLSNMGGYMQPQGHLQLTVAMVAGGLDPQAAIDMPRFCIAADDPSSNSNSKKKSSHSPYPAGSVVLETGIPQTDVDNLEHERGHRVIRNVTGHARGFFGRAQIIQRDRRNGVLWAGSDGRADGCAMGY